MNFSDTVLSGILTAILVWLLTKAAMFIIYKRKLEAGLIVNIGYYLDQIQEVTDYVKNLFDGSIVEGEVVKHAAHHTAESHDYYNAVIAKLPLYLSRKNMIKVVKFYKALYEFQVLTGGFLMDLQKHKENDDLLTKDQVNFLCRKKERIVALGKILCKANGKDLSSLPDDYKGRISPSTIIMK